MSTENTAEKIIRIFLHADKDEDRADAICDRLGLEIKDVGPVAYAQIVSGKLDPSDADDLFDWLPGAYDKALEIYTNNVRSDIISDLSMSQGDCAFGWERTEEHLGVSVEDMWENTFVSRKVDGEIEWGLKDAFHGTSWSAKDVVDWHLNGESLGNCIANGARHCLEML